MSILLLADQTLIGKGIVVDKHVSLKVTLITEIVSTNLAAKRLLTIVYSATMGTHRLNMVKRLSTEVTEELLQMITSTVMGY